MKGAHGKTPKTNMIRTETSHMKGWLNARPTGRMRRDDWLGPAPCV